MLNWILKTIVGSKNQRELRRLQPIVRQVNELLPRIAALSDDELRGKTAAWQAELREIKDNAALASRLEQILPEAFAVVKDAARRLTERKFSFTVCDQPMTWAMVHFDVQLIGGMILHGGRIAEMATGEGKTLVATSAVYLNALTTRGVHVVTVNDYLARRDAEWMGQLYNFLGLTIGIIQHDQPPEIRRAQYECDITYGTNSEFGFDYLRDNGMATSREQQVQRGHYFAIVDEVDSILIDEARTPLIISGPSTVSTHQFDRFKPLVDQLVRKQTMLCNRLGTEVKELLDAGKKDEAGRALFKLKLGQPRSKALARMMEDPEMRKLADKAELEFYKDTDGKAALVELKEELFFTIEERQHDADLTQKGRDFLNPDDADAFVLPDLLTEFADIENDPALSEEQKAAKKAQRQQHTDAQAERIHNISQLLKAYCLYEKDVEYVVEENKVIIVDTFTGRKMPGRRWSDGLHQAVEAKEGVQIDRETQTLATITIQNYFRLYDKLAGMTGTAETEANEFHDIYQLDVNVIPTNRPVRRIDENDRIYKTRREKYNAVIDAIRAAHAKGQPVLVGTASVESSELLSRMLKLQKIPHTVLNAKYHMQEAEIVMRAGLKGAVTISTNMAGRGTDIKLGEGVADTGGLYVIGTERHESRRIDRQLRGRCARQGDPGMSRFYVSFEDDLMRNFGASDRMTKIMETFGLKEGEELEHPWLNKSVETAQKRVEQRNYMIRRRTLEFDDVMNQQREVVYGYRQEVMDSQNPRDLIFEVIDEVVPKKVAEHLEVSDGAEPDYSGLLNWVNTTFPLGLSAAKAAVETRDVNGNSAFLVQIIKEAYDKKAAMEHAEALRGLERYIILNAVDRLWQEHLYAMDGLREAVYLRAFAQKDPLVEYKNEAFSMFSELMDSIKAEVLNNLFRSTTNLQAFENLLRSMPQNLLQADLPGVPRPQGQDAPPQPAPAAPEPSRIELSLKRELPKVGRNDPCPCGSGKKFKSCCGRTA
ncbi:MAG TPA: preprotein translocase subunit SecA [Terrimicrobiaceae bacterium]|nr:preprotein translocase subunit SecA [Terrimicrobiaceae bacterium]